MQVLAKSVVETAQAWEQEGMTTGEGREIIGAVADTFLEHRLLVFMDLPSGSLLVAEVAAERTSATWKAVVDERLKPLGATILYPGSDRAKALIQLAETGFECLSMPDLLHCVHEIVKRDSLAMGRRLRHAQQELTHVETLLTRCLDRAPGRQDTGERAVLVAARRAAVQRWTEVQRPYQNHLETLSLTLPPFALSDSAAQTSTQVASRFQAEGEAIEALAARHQVPAYHAVRSKVRKQWPALAALVDFWWAGVEQDLEHTGLSTPWRTWARECRLPLGYWEPQAAHTRGARRKARLRKAAAASQTAFDTHEITQRRPRQALEEWQAWATQCVRAFQRTSSAVEDRNGYLAQIHHNQRGWPQ